MAELSYNVCQTLKIPTRRIAQTVLMKVCLPRFSLFTHELQRAHRVIKDVNLTVAGHGLEHPLLKIKVVVRSKRIHQTRTMVPRDGPWITYPFTAVARHTYSFFFTARVRWFGVVLIPHARVFDLPDFMRVDYCTVIYPTLCAG